MARVAGLVVGHPKGGFRISLEIRYDEFTNPTGT
jgi:hypothetical protein